MLGFQQGSDECIRQIPTNKEERETISRNRKKRKSRKKKKEKKEGGGVKTNKAAVLN